MRCCPISTNTKPRESFAMLLANTFGSTTRSDHTRRLTIKRRTLSIMHHSAVQQPSPPALTVPRWPVDSIAAWVRRSQDTDLGHAASHCNRPSEPGQGSSTRRGRAATWSMVARFSWRNTTESDLTLKMFTHFSQTVVLTREPPYIAESAMIQ